jgi:poly(hydroxyalkanoate) granule-associated protein
MAKKKDAETPQQDRPEEQNEEQTFDVGEAAHKIWLAGLGVFAAAEEEGSKFFRRMVEKGGEVEEKGQAQFDKVKEKARDVKGVAEDQWQKLGKSFDDKVSDTLTRLGVPDRAELEELNRRIDELTAKIEELKSSSTEG